VLKDFNCMLELVDQLVEIPPVVKALSWVSDLSCLKCG